MNGQNISESLLFGIIQTSLIVSAIIIILLILRHKLQKRYSARIICIIWTLLAIRLIVPIQFTVSEPLITITPRLHYVQFNDIGNDINGEKQIHNKWLNQEETQAIITQNKGYMVLNFNNLLLLVWIIGIIKFLWHELNSYFIFKRNILSNLNKPLNNDLQKIFEEECISLCINKNIKLYISPFVNCPQLISAYKPLLVLPHEQFTDENIRFIIRHELTHLQNGDLWIKYLLVISRAIHWFNPLVHIMANKANEDIELACDSFVVKSLNITERKQYGYTILNSATEQSIKTSMVSCFSGDKEKLMKRFENLFDKSVKKHGLIFSLVIALLMVGCGSSFSIGSVSLFEPSEDERIELAQLWSENQDYQSYTVKLDGKHTLVISEKISDDGIPYRTANELNFERKNGNWNVANNTTIAEGSVKSLKDFITLYENDLGLPDNIDKMDFEKELIDINDYAEMTTKFLRLDGGQIEILGEEDVTNDGKNDLTNIQYTFSDNSAVNIQTVSFTPYTWTAKNGKNNRTSADLAQQFARSIQSKRIWYLYTNLSDENKLNLEKYQQELGGNEPSEIWYSKLGGSSPSYKGYLIIPDENDKNSQIVVFQMYGGGWDDSRCAYRVTIGEENGHSVINEIVEINKQYTNRQLFDLYYNTGLNWPPIVEKGMIVYNAYPLEELMVPDKAANAVFQLDDSRLPFYGAKAEIIYQDETKANVNIIFADKSESVTIEMHLVEGYWIPTNYTQP